MPDFIKSRRGIDKYVNERRLLQADYGELTVASAYFSSGNSSDYRQAFKPGFLSDFGVFADEPGYECPHLIISDDNNIYREVIDIRSPLSNKNASGLLPEERVWFTQFIKNGFVDSFQNMYPEQQKYSWWAYRSGARKRNLSRRIDYLMVNDSRKLSIKNAELLNETSHNNYGSVLPELSL